jgi:hypothetical protein
MLVIRRGTSRNQLNVFLADHKRIGFSAFLTQAPPPTQPERYDETRRFQRVKRAREDSNL